MNEGDDDAPEASTKCEGVTFLYVRAEIARPDPKRIEFFNVLKKIAREAGEPIPDIDPAALDLGSIDALDPGSISFKHVQLVARDEDEAYAIGDGLLPALESDTIVANDYVIRL
jgi:hypothetical protein